MQYSDFQNQPSSEKITLAILSASKRLMGWALHSGSIYKIENFPFAVISSIEDSGTAYTEVDSIGATTASKFYLDRAAQTLYLRASDSSNPNSRFLAVTIKLNMANVPIALPHDLDTGFEVFWEPWIKSTSQFGVSIDTVAQVSEALEGSGTLTLNNDFDFWPTYFDKLSFEHQRCTVYSFNRNLDVSEAKIIFKGSVLKHTYTSDAITFQLQDLFAELKGSPSLSLISELGARTGTDLENAYQRMILGRVFGHVPTNIDQVVDGYPLGGTVLVHYNDTNVSVSSGNPLGELSPGDQVILGGVNYTVAGSISDLGFDITEPYLGIPDLVAASITVIPDRPKRYINRIFNVSGHALREPTTVTLNRCSVQILFVDSTRDMHDGDIIYVGALGSGEVATISQVIGEHYIRLSTSLNTSPLAGVLVTRPAVQNVRIDDVLLSYYSDYTFDASTGTLTLSTEAEANACPIFQLANNLTFTNGSRTVSGTGFNGNIYPGYKLGVVGNAVFFEVLSVDSDVQITLREEASFTGTGLIRFKSLIYDPNSTVLTLDALGRTDDGTTSGILLKTAPSLNRALLQDSGLSDELNTDSFDEADEIAYQQLGKVIPVSYSNTSLPTYRDLLNEINKSVFGALVQNPDFEFAYQVLRPKKTMGALKFTESDIFTPEYNATSENVVKTSIVTYQPREYDYLIKDVSIKTSQKTSDNATYIIKTDNTKTIDTLLVESKDADTTAARWSFILQTSTGRLSFSTKLQGSRLAIGDIIEIEHRKLFERFGSNGKRKLLMVESIDKSGTAVKIEATDLSNTFNRVCTINEFTDDWSTSSEDDKLYGGYYTDQYGLVSNDPTSFETNLIW